MADLIVDCQFVMADLYLLGARDLKIKTVSHQARHDWVILQRFCQVVRQTTDPQFNVHDLLIIGDVLDGILLKLNQFQLYVYDGEGSIVAMRPSLLRILKAIEHAINDQRMALNREFLNEIGDNDGRVNDYV